MEGALVPISEDMSLFVSKARNTVRAHHYKTRLVYSSPQVRLIIKRGRVVARSENPRGLVVLGGDNVSPQPPACDGPEGLIMACGT